jgi:hypothetical protein
MGEDAPAAEYSLVWTDFPPAESLRVENVRHVTSAVRNLTRLFYRWLFTSMRFDRRVKHPGADTLYVWHDKLVLERQEDQLAAILGLRPLTAPIALGEANQHAIAGNKFVFSERRTSIKYDARWTDWLSENCCP